MSDSSPLVPWVTAALGCVFSYAIARLSPLALSFGGVLLAGAKAFGLSIVLFFVGSLMHGLCISRLHQCSDHGDVNITYAMGGVLAFPLFWLIIALFGKGGPTEQVSSLLNRCEAASSAAIMEHVGGKVASSKCPACAGVINAYKTKPASGGEYLATSCGCGKCDRKFKVRKGEA